MQRSLPQIEISENKTAFKNKENKKKQAGWAFL